MGEFASSKMTVEVVLAPRNQSDLEDQLAGVYRSGSPSYHQWLQTGEFYERYAPDASQVAAVVSHLSASGLTVEPSSSPFLVRASGPSSLVASAFATRLHNYRNRSGINYFANSADIKLPKLCGGGLFSELSVSPILCGYSRMSGALPTITALRDLRFLPARRRTRPNNSLPTPSWGFPDFPSAMGALQAATA